MNFLGSGLCSKDPIKSHGGESGNDNESLFLQLSLVMLASCHNLEKIAIINIFTIIHIINQPIEWSHNLVRAHAIFSIRYRKDFLK